MKILKIVFGVAAGGFALLIVLGVIGSSFGLVPVDPVSPPATVDDVYAAVSIALGGATPDFDTQVKPLLDQKLTYAELQALLTSGRILSVASPTDSPAPTVTVGPKVTGGPVLTAGPVVITAPPVTAAPNTARTVPMSKVLDLVRSQWTMQPMPICTRGMTCQQPFNQPASITCDHTGDVAVPVAVSCSYVDGALSGTIAINVDANNVVGWRGCSFSDPRLPCLQAAPTQAPVVVPTSAPVQTSCGGRGYINVSVTDFTGHPVQILIDGLWVGNGVVNGYAVAVGSHAVQFVHYNGSSTVQSGYVADCKSWTIRGG